RHKPKRDRQPSTEWLDEPTVLVSLPQRLEIRHEPAFATDPFEWWFEAAGRSLKHHLSRRVFAARSPTPTNAALTNESCVHVATSYSSSTAWRTKISGAPSIPGRPMPSY